MEKILDFFAKLPTFQQITAYANNLSPDEQMIVAIGLAVLLLIFVWRRLGIIPFIAALFALMFAFVLFRVNIKGFYEQQTAEQNVRMNGVQEEIDKK